MLRKVSLFLLFSMALVFVLVSFYGCGESEVEATVKGYVLSDTLYQLGVPGVQVILTVENAENMPDYQAFTDSTGFYSITFETGYIEQDEHFLPNEVAEVSLTFIYRSNTMTISGIHVRRGQVYVVRHVYLHEFSGGGGRGGG